MRVEFVCWGNICRSPTAEVVLRKMAGKSALHVTSSGVAAHVGEPIDAMSLSALLQHGYTVPDHRARRFDNTILDVSDLVIALDRTVALISGAYALAPQRRAKIRLLSDYLPRNSALDVPNPWRASPQVYADVLRTIETGCEGILERIETKP